MMKPILREEAPRNGIISYVDKKRECLVKKKKNVLEKSPEQ